MNSSGVANMLDVEFNTFRLLFKKHLSKLSSSEQTVAIKWVSRLKDVYSNDERKLRNKFIAELIMQMQTGALNVPFNTNPPRTSLEDVKLPSKSTAQDVFPKSFKLAHDYGAFLVSDPVPHCGAFCYLAVVGKPKGN